ncbi:hypothetical protein HRbin17_02659 [bacterium HR17]|uniref:Invasin domain-containing protein n=1 Tax=Candidatus Fervidibacter japonicus TaxID=2035412 RepID=A0A2H5XG08_9BACT|nr:hypothetical protein HRbin17_02659 [bacterium HR17]
MRVWLCCFLLSVALAEVNAQTPLTQRFTFALTASRPFLIADGKSTCDIIARVDDPALEGTVIHFTSSLEGTVIEPQAVLRRGVAQVRLQAGTTPGVTVVTAFFGSSRQTLEVQLLPPDAVGTREASVIVMSGDYIAYAPQYQFVAGSGKVRLLYRGWEVRSDVRLDFWIDSKVVVAEGTPGANRVVLTDGQTQWAGDRLLADMERQVAVLTRVVPEARRIVIKGWLLREGTEEDIAGLQEPLPPSDLDVNWVRGREFVLYPHNRLVVRRAQIYLRGQKVISLPLYVEMQSGSAMAQPFRSTPNMPLGLQGISVTAYGGLQLDTPIYYRADLHGTGAVRLQYFGGRGFSAYRPGFALSLEEQYTLGNQGQSEGGVYLEQITRPDWSLRWQHFQRLGERQQLDMFVDFLRHRDLFARFGYRGTLGDNIGLGVEANFQKAAGFGTQHGLQAYAYLPGGILGKTGISYTLSSAIAWQPSGFGSALRWGVDANFTLPAHRWRRGQLTTQVGVSLADAGNGVQLPWRLVASLNYPIGQQGALTLSYNLDKGRSFFGTGSISAESLSLNLFVRLGRAWTVYGMGTWNLRGGSRYHSIFASYDFRPGWRFVAELTQQGYARFTYTDYTFRLMRHLGSGIDLSLNWSKSRRRFYLELGALQF